MALGLGAGLGKGGIIGSIPGVVTDNLVMKHMYPAGAVQPLSDGAAYFDGPGDDDYITCGAINLGTSFSAGGWFWINSTGQDQWATLLGQAIYDSDHIEGFVLRLSTNDLNLSFGDDTNGAQDHAVISNFLTTAGNTNNWVHLYFTISGDATGSKTSKLYQNGVLMVTDTSVNFEGTHASSNFTIGKGVPLNPSDSALKGYASNVSIYSRELTQAEIKSIMWKQYADLSTSEKTSLVSWWNLDESFDGTHNGDANIYFVEDNHNSSTESLGPELNTHSNATNPTSDTNSTTGWVNTDMDVFESSDTYSTVGNYSLHLTSADADDHAASTAFTTETGALYRLSWDFKVTNHSGTSSVAFRIGTTADNSSSSYDMADYRSNAITSASDTDWVSVTKYFIADSTSTYFNIKEIGSSDAPDMYIDNLSLKKVGGSNPGELK